MKRAILEKLLEIETMLAQATCDGQAIVEDDTVHKDLTCMLQRLTEAVEYYID